MTSPPAIETPRQSLPPSADADDSNMEFADDMAANPAAVDLANAGDDVSELVLEPRKGWIAIDWAELWRHRELLYFLVWRDVKVRYKQAILGFAWAVVAPLIGVVIFTLVFGEAAGMKDQLPADIPYPLYVFAAMIPWQMLAASISQGGLSLVSQQNLLSKIYLPRLFIPSAVVGGALVDMAVALGLLGCMMLWYGVAPAWTIIFLPGVILLTMLAGLAFSYTLSALTVTYRDLRFLIPYAVQLLLLISAIGYPPSAFSSRPWIIDLNPIAGIVGASRAAIFGDVPLDAGHLALSVAMIAALFVFGLFNFRRTERRFADIA